MAKRASKRRVAEEIVGAQEAADDLGLHPRRILQLIDDGTIRAKQIGREWAMLRDDLEPARHRRPRGRPKSKPTE